MPMMIPSMISAMSLLNQYSCAFESFIRASIPLTGAAGAAEGAPADAVAWTGVPQAGQKVAPSGSSFPHFEQNATSASSRVWQGLPDYILPRN
jgi:hypothetical protein